MSPNAALCRVAVTALSAFDYHLSLCLLEVYNHIFFSNIHLLTIMLAMFIRLTSKKKNSKQKLCYYASSSP